MQDIRERLDGHAARAADYRARADQIAAELRDSRHCDALALCRRHRAMVETERRLRLLAREEDWVGGQR